ncbi:MAG: universal stress protein [Nitrospirae bacterium]|nr:universal stress protein [Nitrospirota bacterium]NTW66945.1 universal stress protein [Nitrospirota bacterium]
MKKVLIAVDETEGSKAVLSVFQNMVRPPESVVLVHVQQLEGKSMMIDMLGEAELNTLREALKGTDYKESLDRKSERILNFYRKELENGGLVSVKTIIRDGITSEEILKVAQEESVDLIVTGYNGKTFMQRMVTGSISKDIEKHAPVPVLVAKNPSAEEKFAWTSAAAVGLK